MFSFPRQAKDQGNVMELACRRKVKTQERIPAVSSFSISFVAAKDIIDAATLKKLEKDKGPLDVTSYLS